MYSRKKFALEKQDGKYTSGDGSIRNIEDRSEEYKTLPSPYWEPAGEDAIFNDGKIKHVYHPSMQEAFIPSHETLCPETPCKVLRIGIAELKSKSVKKAVDQVANRTCINEGHTDDVSIMVPFFQDTHDIIGAEAYRNQPKQSQCDLTKTASELPAIGHSLILEKMKPEPRNRFKRNQLFLHVKMRLDIDLDSLINKKDQKSYEQYMFELHAPQFLQI